MTNTTKGSAPDGAPPAYGSQTSTPQHMDAGPANSPYPPPQAHISQPNAYNNKPYQGTPQGGYYQPGPMQYGPPQGGGYYGQQQQGGYYGQPQQGGYYGQQQGYYGGGYGRPQGQYMNDPRGQSSGFGEAMLASLACCCCLDACLLF